MMAPLRLLQMWTQRKRPAHCAAAAVVVASLGTAAAGDTITITLDASVASEPVAGRLVVSFITPGGPSGPRGPGGSPLDGPFYRNPQPMAGTDIEMLTPGESVSFDRGDLDWFRPIDDVTGPVRVAAILDRDDTVSSRVAGPGNLVSAVASLSVSAEREDTISLVLKSVVAKRELPAAPANLKWVSARSETLSAFYGRDIFHRAGVALPRGYDDPQNADSKWPTIYVIPGFGGRETSAVNYAAMLERVEPEFIPQAVWIVLDPDSPLGHHGFCDSQNNGPRGTALVHEFIPHLETQFRLDNDPRARVLYGHSSGGWSALWLQLSHPESFGGCWSSAPDPIDFSRFQYSNLYQDRNLYAFGDGKNDTPSFRVVDFEGRDVVYMTVREECVMERVIDPNGQSGEQWDAWEAMWSPRDPHTGLPRPMFDARTGEINRDVVNEWKRYDIRALLMQKWDTLGPVMTNKVRLFCGEHDNFYLNRAVERVQQLVVLRNVNDEASGQGYVEIVEFAAHGSLINLFTDRMHREMIAYLESLK